MITREDVTGARVRLSGMLATGTEMDEVLLKEVPIDLEGMKALVNHVEDLVPHFEGKPDDAARAGIYAGFYLAAVAQWLSEEREDPVEEPDDDWPQAG